ncbi:MAG: hypothetical protein ACFE8E_14175 [Candidatus Hodarchaeota archaeon]
MTIFLIIGRPGAGKSTAINIFKNFLLKESNKEIIILDDFDLLYNWYHNDKLGYFKPYKSSGFEIINYEIYNKALKEIIQKLQEIHENEPNKIIFVEFSRDNYISAFSLIPEEILQKAHIIYIYSDLNKCLERNELRESTPRYVPYEVISKNDDFNDLHSLYENRLIIINNQKDISSLKNELEFNNQIKEIIKQLKT